ncbi:MAG: hypothetical protein ACI9VM_000730 [Candidatus Azotimanducaceae bacterium]|jgi:hypothetical protein
MSLFNLEFKKIPFFGATVTWFEDEDFEYAKAVLVFGILLLYFAFSSSETLAGSSITFFLVLTPLWLPYILLDLFHLRWMDYVGKKYYFKSGRTLFRIKLPPEVTKSPEAMEQVLRQIEHPQNPHNLMQTYLGGRQPLPISLEIVSIGGDVRFYVSVDNSKAKPAFVPAMYSQYPGVELIEEPVDYAGEISPSDPDWEMIAFHPGKKKNIRSIHTYVDQRLDSMPKEEEKTDPMTIMLEFLGSIGPNERLYYQFILMPERDKRFKAGQFQFGTTKEDWTEDAQKYVDELMVRDPKTKASAAAEDDEAEYQGSVRITPGEREDIETLERQMSKPVFKVGMKYFYLAKKGHFRNIQTPINMSLRPFNRPGRGEIGTRWRTDFNYKFLSDPFGKRLARMKHQEHREYKLRKYNPKNLRDGYKIFSIEEIATMFHLPGSVASTPTLGRVESARSQAPSNLPVGDFQEKT